MPTADPSPGTRQAGACDWNAAYAALAEAGIRQELPPEDLERQAVAAFMLGLDDEAVSLRQRAYQDYLDRGDVERAVRCGFWLGFHLQARGETAQAGGWAAQLSRIAADGGYAYLVDYLRMPQAVSRLWSGNPSGALPIFERAARTAASRADADMAALAGLGRGSCLQVLGRWDEAATVLDEVMVHVLAGEVAPQVTGLAYCAVVASCVQQFDFRRAQEWTEALASWLADQHGAVPYRGVCQVHRAEILQLRGAWLQAREEAERACTALLRSGEAATGAAHYRVGELARLAGRLDAAEQAYQRAVAYGYEVQPGLGRLRLAQGRPELAASGLDRALAELPAGTPSRAPLLAARIDAAIALSDVDCAHHAQDELCQLADACGAGYLQAVAEQCAGAIALTDGHPGAALGRLRRALATWQQLDAPYETALTRLDIARACVALGDHDAAAMERDAARTALRRLGAVADLAALDGTSDGTSGAPAHPLSPRELEVLRLLATGATNRAIAAQLVLSEKTVARHVSNILAKLGLASRSAATAYAYENGLA